MQYINILIMSIPKQDSIFGELDTLVCLSSRQPSLVPLVPIFFLLEFIPWKGHLIVEREFEGIVGFSEGIVEFREGPWGLCHRTSVNWCRGCQATISANVRSEGLTLPNSFQRNSGT